MLQSRFEAIIMTTGGTLLIGPVLEVMASAIVFANLTRNEPNEETIYIAAVAARASE